MHLLFYLFIVLFGCYGNIDGHSEWPEANSVCGDGVVMELNEECDSVSHCTNCLCDTGYYPSGNNSCIPICEVEGCLTGCTAPNQCNTCNTSLGFISDCHSCNLKTHFAKGFLSCRPNEQYYSCSDYLDFSTKELSLANPEVTILSSEHQLNAVKKTAFLYGPNPIAEGAWVKLSITEKSYYIIETIQQNTEESLQFSFAQDRFTEEDTVLLITDSCRTDSSYGIITENNDVSERVKSSRIIREFEIGTYYLFIFTPYNKGFDFHSPIYLSKIVHPCGITATRIPISSISNVFSQTVYSAFNTESSSSCVSFQQKGKWFFVEGANLNVRIDTCSSITSYPTSIFVLRINKKEHTDGLKVNISNIDCTADTECFKSSYTGCENDDLAAVIIEMDETHDYFIHVVQKSPLGSEYVVKASIVCPLNCGGNGSCDVKSGNCSCKPGYTLNSGVCSLCGNGKHDPSEECDSSVNSDTLCDSTSCYCKFGYVSVSSDSKVECRPPKCGDGVIDSLEECDGGLGCKSNCQCDDGYVPYSGIRTDCLSLKCGNNELDEGEECDGGDGCYQCQCEEGWYPYDSTRCRRVARYLYWIICAATIAAVYWIFLIATSVLTFSLYRRLNGIIMIDLENLDLIESKMQVFDSQIVPFDSTNAQFVDSTISNPLFSFDSTKISFESCGDMPDVDDPVLSVITLTNLREENLHFIFHGVNNEKYKLAFKPTTGIIKKNKYVEIQVHLLVKCTCVLRCKIPVTLRYGQAKDVLKDLKENNPELIESNSQNSKKSDKSDNRSVSSSKQINNIRSSVSSNSANKKKKPTQNKNINKFFTHLTFEVSSGLSTKLDYDEIILQPPSIGEGAFGVVYKGIWRSVDVAVKQLKTQGVSDVDKLVSMFTREAELLEKIRCPYIVGFIGCVTNKEHLCLLTEFCPLGSLRKMLKKQQLEEDVKVRICQDISRGMEYLHINDILHSDLKTDNVLMVSLNPHDSVLCKVSDFGTSRCFIESSKGLGIKDIGTPVYMAPEVHQSEQITLKSDVYSFAICMLEIWNSGKLYNEELFPDVDSVLRFVCAGKRLEIPQQCPYKELIQRCWNPNPKERPQFREIAIILDALGNREDTKTNETGSSVSRSESPTISIFPPKSVSPSKSGVIKPKTRYSLKPNGLIATLTKSPNGSKKQINPNRIVSPSFRKISPNSSIVKKEPLVPKGDVSNGDVEISKEYPLSGDPKRSKGRSLQNIQRMSALPEFTNRLSDNKEFLDDPSGSDAPDLVKWKKGSQVVKIKRSHSSSRQSEGSPSDTTKLPNQPIKTVTSVQQLVVIPEKETKKEFNSANSSVISDEEINNE